MLLPFFQWCESTALGTAIRMSPWAFAVIESVHLLGLAVIGGAVLLVDLRMLGFGLKNQRIAEIARAAFPWLVGSLVVMLLTGVGSLPVGTAQVLRQPGVLGEDDQPGPRDAVHVHDPPDGDDGG